MRYDPRLLLLSILAVAAALTGCGIAAENQAREVEPPPGPYRALASQAPDNPEPQPGSFRQTLFLIKDGALVPVVRHVSLTPTVDTLLRDLLAGPTNAERAQGLTSALSGANVTGTVRLSDGQAAVDVVAAPEGAGRNDEVLAYAQVVCTLDAHPDVTGVVFRLRGQPIGVPRRDAPLSEEPLTTADYANLISDG